MNHTPPVILALLLGLGLGLALGAAERINQEGRILGPLPSVGAPILFNTAAADAVVAAMQIMPRDSAWNEDVSRLTVAANSDAMIADIRADVAIANRQRVVVFQEMNYVLVPDNQPLAAIGFFNYPDESDDLDPANNQQGLWPIPGNMPIETWPSGQPGLSNLQWQEDVYNTGGDRHSIIVMPSQGWIWETWMARLTAATPAWTASNGAKFPLGSNAPRPALWTSGDAAGLPLFPALVRYDEAERGMVEHAMRIVVKRSRKAYLYPATHQAGSTTDPAVPAMGQRLRLKASFAIPASWSVEERAIALGLKKYGALVADNGSFFSISICPDDRWPANCFSHLATGAAADFCDIANFEVVAATGAAEGPRSPGAPTVDAGADQTVTLAGGATLSGSATGSGLTLLWYAYPGTVQPGTVTFSSPSTLASTAQFSAVGSYTLMLRASDGIHAPAYAATRITVQSGANPAPVLAAIAPATVVQGSGSFTLTLTGSGFVAASQVAWSGETALAALTASPTQLTVAVPAAYAAAAGQAGIQVVNPAPGGGASTSLALTISAASTPVAGAGGAGGAGGGGGSGGSCGLGALAATLALGLMGLCRRRG